MKPPGGLPRARRNERPSEYADRLGRWHRERTPDTTRKTRGQYFTPVAIARFMASLPSLRAREPWILDPGAGTGVLTCAVCERLGESATPPSRIHARLFESDPRLVPLARRALGRLERWLEQRGVRLDAQVEAADFALDASKRLRETEPGKEMAPVYDLAISNPPYFKIARSDPRAQASRGLASGQTNIYALFMSLSAKLLAPRGELVFITPRSFASGAYFRRFRREFFEQMRPERLHGFLSRSQIFKRDAILQENVILHARRVDGWQRRSRLGKLTLSMTNADVGNDVGAEGDATGRASAEVPVVEERKVERTSVFDLASRDPILFLPSSREDDRVIRLVHGWTQSLAAHGWEVSTGPVVAFRARPYLETGTHPDRDQAPLLWMQHVQPMCVRWPLDGFTRPQLIHMGLPAAQALLRPDHTCVVLRRFSGKEDARRLVVAPLERGQLASAWRGFENHLNVIQRPGGELTQDEAWGLAALLGSRLLDRYFRTLSGSTQVNAAELRSLRLPTHSIVCEIGARVRESADPAREADRAVDESLC